MFHTATRIDPAHCPTTPPPALAAAARGAEINLAAFDLNLLVALDALLECRNVTHAGQRVGLSQPAMSRSLARLRGMLKDDLLVRSSTGMVPTPRAERLADALPPVMAQIRELLDSRSFAPGECRSRVTLAMSDHQALVLLPRLLPRVQERAPNLDVVADSSLAGALKRLEQGEIDFAIGQLHDTPSGTYQRKLYSDRFACLVRRDHPALSQPWTPDSFAALRHAVIAPGSEDGFGKIYDSLARLHLPDRDPVLVPNAMTAPMMIAETDLALTVPHRVATRLAEMLPLRVMEVPVELPPYEVCLIWHERRHRDPENRWMRGEIAAATLAAI
jgi:DNA-binding transcriptional LysR family regulator